MTNGSACVDGLADLVGWTAGSSFHFDWPVVEQSLGGLALPGDYKALVERFPSGKFRELVKVIRPGDVNSPPTDYLGYYAHRLEDMRKGVLPATRSSRTRSIPSPAACCRGPRAPAGSCASG